MGRGPNDRRLSAYYLRRACEASLRRLQTKNIDLYQMHLIVMPVRRRQTITAVQHSPPCLACERRGLDR